MKSLIEKRKQGWGDFYDGKKEVLYLIGYDYGVRPLPFSRNKNERIRYASDMYEKQCELTESIDDDRIPYLHPYTGTEIFACAFGCEVYEPADNMPFALPKIHDCSEVARLKYPSLDCEPIAEIFDIADRLRAIYPDGDMALPDIQSPLDIAALIWSKEDLFAAMYDAPEAVDELCRMTESFLTEFVDEWFKRYGTDFIAHYPDYYMPGGITLSEDEAGAISPEMFVRFSLDSLNRLSERYGSIGMHCCANSIHQWENFKKIKNLSLLNIVQPHNIMQKGYSFFNGHCAQMHAENLDANNKEIKKIIVQGYARDISGAKESLKSLRDLYER